MKHSQHFIQCCHRNSPSRVGCMLPHNYRMGRVRTLPQRRIGASFNRWQNSYGRWPNVRIGGKAEVDNGEERRWFSDMDETLKADGRRRVIRIARNVLGSFGAAGAWTLAAGSFVVTAHWFNLAPKIPEPARGAVLEHNEHGWIVYFTKYQTVAAETMLFVGMLLFFTSLSIITKKRVLDRTFYGSKKVRSEIDDPEGVQRRAAVVGATAGLAAIYGIDPALPNWLVGLAQDLFGLIIG